MKLNSPYFSNESHRDVWRYYIKNLSYLMVGLGVIRVIYFFNYKCGSMSNCWPSQNCIDFSSKVALQKLGYRIKEQKLFIKKNTMSRVSHFNYIPKTILKNIDIFLIEFKRQF